MSQEEIVVPKGWKKTTLEKCISNILGGDWGDDDLESIPKEYVRVKILRATEMSNWLQQKGKTGVTRIIKKSSLEKRQLKPNDLILEISGGSTKFTVGRCVLIDEEVLQGDSPVICSNFFRRITLNKDVDPKFIHYFLYNFHAAQRMVQYISKSTNIQNLKVPQLLSHTFVIPSLPIQKKIVVKLDHILGELEVKKKEIIAIIEQNKERIDFFEKNWMSYVIDKEIEKHPQREEWELKKLGDPDVSEIIMGQSPPSSTYNTEKNGLPFFQGKKDFGDKFPTVRTWCNKPKKIAKKGDILISVRAPVGSTNWAKEECCIGRGLSAIRVKIEPEYVYYFIKSLERKLSKSGTGSVFNSISKPYLFQIQIPVPDTSIQKQIIQNIKSAEEKFKKQKTQFENIKNNYESKINYINHIQSSILDSAFSGKLLN